MPTLTSQPTRIGDLHPYLPMCAADLSLPRRVTLSVSAGPLGLGVLRGETGYTYQERRLPLLDLGGPAGGVSKGGYREPMNSVSRHVEVGWVMVRGPADRQRRLT